MPKEEQTMGGLWEKAVEEGVKRRLKGKVRQGQPKTLIMKVVFGVGWSSRYD